MRRIAPWALMLVGLVTASLAVAGTADAAGAAGLFQGPYFILGIAVIAVSVVWQRRLQARGSNQDATWEADLAQMAGLLHEIIAVLEKLAGELPHPRLDQLVARVETLQKNQIFDIVESREAIIRARGFGFLGAFMGAFSVGERFTARCWSAGVDGYEEEAFACLERAIPFFRQAQGVLEARPPSV